MLSAGSGSYDWKQVKNEFTTPKEANVASLGTVLRGTGTAWFDDVELVCLDLPRQDVTARAEAPERLELIDVGAATCWPAGADAAAFDYRFPIRALNGSERALSGGLIGVDLSGPLARLNRSVDPGDIRVMDGTKRVKSYHMGRLLLFEGQVERRSQRTFYVYFRRGNGESKNTEPIVREYAANPALPGGQSKEAVRSVAAEDYKRLLCSPSNRIKNADFASGDKLPERWSGGIEGLRIAGVKMGFAEAGAFSASAAWKWQFPPAPSRMVRLAAGCARGAGKVVSSGRVVEVPGPQWGSLQLHFHIRNARASCAASGRWAAWVPG